MENIIGNGWYNRTAIEPQEFPDDRMVLINGKSVDIRNVKHYGISDIREIAGPISKICRYAGRIPDFFSVAEHSVILANLFQDDKIMAQYALLHDAHEAFTGDIIYPIKMNYMNDMELRSLVRDLDAAIFLRFGLYAHLPGEVDHGDHELCREEWKYFTGGGRVDNPGIRFLDHKVAYAIFIMKAEELGLR